MGSEPVLFLLPALLLLLPSGPQARYRLIACFSFFLCEVMFCRIHWTKNYKVNVNKTICNIAVHLDTKDKGYWLKGIGSVCSSDVVVRDLLLLLNHMPVFILSVTTRYWCCSWLRHSSRGVCSTSSGLFTADIIATALKRLDDFHIDSSSDLGSELSGVAAAGWWFGSWWWITWR